MGEKNYAQKKNSSSMILFSCEILLLQEIWQRKIKVYSVNSCKKIALQSHEIMIIKLPAVNTL